MLRLAWLYALIKYAQRKWQEKLLLLCDVQLPILSFNPLGLVNATYRHYTTVWTSANSFRYIFLLES